MWKTLSNKKPRHINSFQLLKEHQLTESTNFVHLFTSDDKLVSSVSTSTLAIIKPPQVSTSRLCFSCKVNDNQSETLNYPYIKECSYV